MAIDSHRSTCGYGLFRHVLTAFSLRYLMVLLSLVSLSVTASNDDTTPSQVVADITLPTWNGWGQRLMEWRGQAVIVIALPECQSCEQTLIRYQLHLESLQHQGLIALLVWPHDTPPPNTFRLPVLRFQPDTSPAWLNQQKNSVIYLNTNSEVVRIDPLDLRRDYETWRINVRDWLVQQAPSAHLY